MVKIKLIDLCRLLIDIDSPLGDLCNDILRDTEFPQSDKEGWKYLNIKRIGRYYLEEPCDRLKTIYNAINK